MKSSSKPKEDLRSFSTPWRIIATTYLQSPEIQNSGEKTKKELHTKDDPRKNSFRGNTLFPFEMLPISADLVNTNINVFTKNIKCESESKDIERFKGVANE